MSKFPIAIYVLIVNLFFGLSQDLKAMEISPDHLLSELTKEIASYWSETPGDYLKNLSALARVNHNLREKLSDKNILLFFCNAFRDNIAVKISKKTGNNIAHLLAKFRKYSLIPILLDKCKDAKNIIRSENNYMEKPFLTLLIYKDNNSFTQEFDKAFWLLFNKNFYKSYTSHSYAPRSLELMAKLSDEQKKALKHFDEPRKVQLCKFSKTFSHAIEGDDKYFLSKKRLLKPLQFKGYGYCEDTPLHVAARNGHEACLKYFLSTKKGKKYINSLNIHKNTPLILASGNGHLKCIQLLLEYGADINTKKRDNFTAVMYAAKNGSAPCVDLLIKHKADINFQGKNGKTVLMYAAQKGDLNIVEKLLNNNAQIDLVDNYGRSLLELAEVKEHDKVVEFLLSHNFPSKIGGKSLCHRAAKKNLPNLIDKLVKHGHDIELPNSHGVTALMSAAKHGHLTCLEKFIALGANINRKDNQGRTALMFAIKWGRIDSVEKLLELGAQVDTKDNEGNTVLSFAQEKEQILIMLADKLIEKARKVDFDYLIEAYVAMKKYKLHDKAAFIKSLFVK